MLNPPIESLVKKVNSKYALVIATAKRARQIVSARKQSLLDTRKAVTIALAEILEDKICILSPDQKTGKSREEAKSDASDGAYQKPDGS